MCLTVFVAHYADSPFPNTDSDSQINQPVTPTNASDLPILTHNSNITIRHGLSWPTTERDNQLTYEKDLGVYKEL
jgi:hypothetical protein